MSRQPILQNDLRNFDTNLLHFWVQIIGEKTVSIRTITLADKCPSLIVDYKLVSMTSRCKTKDLAFRELHVCQYDANKAQHVFLDGKSMPLFPQKLEKFVTVGDSGCDNNYKFDNLSTNCSDISHWKYQGIANKIYEQHPDFVIHLGDITYTKHNNTFKTFSHVTSVLTEFFAPSQKFLSEIPIIMVRGNHDNCANGNAWSIFFDANEYKADCQKSNPNYSVIIDDVQFIVLDVSTTSYGKTPYSLKELENIQMKFIDAYNLIEQEQIFVCLHQPVLNMSYIFGDHKRQVPVVYDTFFVFNNSKAVYLSGHYHLSGYLEYASIKQFISGSGGFDLQILSKDQLDLIEENFQEESFLYSERGYEIFSRDGDYWNAHFFDFDANVNCLIKEDIFDNY